MKNNNFYKTEYDVYIYNDGIKKYTQEEVDVLNQEENEINNKALEKIIEDGFIHFPVFFDNGNVFDECKFYVHPDFTPSCMDGFYDKYKMNFNIYIPSYGRAGNAKTIDMLQSFNMDNWYVAIDPSQYKDYCKYYDKKHIIIRDPSFRDEKKIDLLSSIKSPNSMHGTAGIYNSLLFFSKSLGETHYWTIDDDILGMAMKARKGDVPATANEVYDKNNYYRCSNIKEEYGFSFADFMSSIEDLTMKMRNPGFVGLEKFGLVFALPVIWKPGTRVYSFYLSSNKTQINHYGQHNNDVVTSLGLSKHGLVNMLFEGISYNSGATQAGGGLTEVYKKFGTLDKGKVLVKAHPAWAKISMNYNRIHHTCNYTVYNGQRLVGAIKK